MTSRSTTIAFNCDPGTWNGFHYYVEAGGFVIDADIVAPSTRAISSMRAVQWWVWDECSTPALLKW